MQARPAATSPVARRRPTDELGPRRGWHVARRRVGSRSRRRRTAATQQRRADRVQPAAARGLTRRAPRRQLDHEAGSGLAVQPVLDPHPPAVHAHVLVDERQPEPGAVAAGAPAGTATAGEALEDQRRAPARARRDRGPRRRSGCGDRLLRVVDHGDRDLRLAATVRPGVVDQVGDHAGQPTTIARISTCSARSDDCDRRRGQAS